MQIVTPTRPTVNPVQADRGGKPDAYWNGFNRYLDGARLEDMQGHEERNGWWWALSREAECNTPRGGSR